MDQKVLQVVELEVVVVVEVEVVVGYQNVTNYFKVVNPQVAYSYCY